MIIAIDGTSGSGKSTVAKLLSESLKFELLNTGLIYRKITKECLSQNIDFSNISKIIELIHSISFNNLTDEDLHTEIISKMVPLYASNDKIRNEVRKIQQSKAKIDNIIVEGRDIGTVVFPNANVKLFIDANINERANRRMKQLGLNGNSEYKNILENLEKRDNQDENRDHSPLRKAIDAIIIDTTSKEIDEVVNYCKNIIQNCLTTAST